MPRIEPSTPPPSERHRGIISEDLSQVTRVILMVLLVQSEDYVWFMDSHDYFRFQKDVIDAAARSMPNMNCCKITKKIVRRYRYLGQAPSIVPDYSGPQLPDNPPVDTKPVALNHARLTYT